MDDAVDVVEVELLTEVVAVVLVLEEQAVVGGDGVATEEGTRGTKDAGPLVEFPVKVGIPDLIRSEVRLLRKEDAVGLVDVWSFIVWMVDVRNILCSIAVLSSDILVLLCGLEEELSTRSES